MHRRGGQGSGSMLRRLADSMFQLQNEADQLASMTGFPFGRRGGLMMDPFSLMDTLSRDFAPGLQTVSRLVSIEVEENEHDYTLHAEVPGLSKEDIKITLEPPSVRGMGALLTISGSKQSEDIPTTPTATPTPEGQTTEGQASGSVGSINAEGASPMDANTSGTGAAQQGEQRRSRRRQAISFSRSLTLPMDVDLEAQMLATTKDGVLTLVLPKIDQAKQQSNVKTITIN
jgi:HSP20 family molecular chaperone IbpA